MANKRMFTIYVVDSDAFLDMPLSTQALYFHLCMRADDDGFIGNPKRVQSLIGASEDDLKLLIAKRFILTFEDGVIVIKHWRMHNTLSTNRYRETVYLDNKSMMKLKPNGAYTLGENGVPLDDSKLIEKSNRQVRRAIDAQKTHSDIGLGLDIDLDIDKDKGLEEIKEKVKKEKSEVVYYPEDEKLNKAFLDFIDMRKKIKKPMTERAITLATNKLREVSVSANGTMDYDKAIAVVNRSILNCWTSFYPIEGDRKKRNKQEIDWENI